MTRRPASPAGPELSRDASHIKDAAAAWKTRADAGLTSREESELREWLEADAHHRVALERYDLVWERFDGPYRAGATDVVLQELSARARRRRRVISAAAAGVALFAVGWMWRSGTVADRANPAITSSNAHPNAILLLPERQVLPDGSVAELRAGAKLTVNFTPAFRRVTLLRGEVHFQVTKDAARPFIVSAAGVETRAVGTAFLVGLRPDGVEVLVTEGRVSVNHAEGTRALATAAGFAPDTATHPEPLAFVDAGNGILVGKGEGPSSPQLAAVNQAQLDDHLSWRAPRVEFTRISLAEAVAVLNGYSAGRRSAGQSSTQFLIDDPVLNDVRISGLFRVDNTEAFVGLLKNGFGIQAERRVDGEIRLRKMP
jgi:transmembrane sensor